MTAEKERWQRLVCKFREPHGGERYSEPRGYDALWIAYSTLCEKQVERLGFSWLGTVCGVMRRRTPKHQKLSL